MIEMVDPGDPSYSAPPSRGRLRLVPCEDVPRGALEPLLLALEAGALPRGAERIKESGFRDVHALTIPGVGEVFIKRKRSTGIDLLRSLVCRPRSELEAGNLKLAGDAGVPCPRAVLYGVRRWYGLVTESVLVVRSLRPCESLRKVLQEGGASADAALQALGKEVAILHDAGFCHRDLHAGNVMVRETDAGPRVWFLDLQKMRRGRRTASSRAADLGQLVSKLDADRRSELLKAYADAQSGGIERDLQGAIQRELVRRRARVARNRERSCMDHSFRFKVDRRDGMKVCRHDFFPLSAALEAVSRHDGCLAGKTDPAATLLQARKSRSVTRQSAVASDPAIVVKAYADRGWLRSIATLFYRHGAKSAWLAAHVVRALGLPTPQPLALVEKKKLGLVRASYFISRWVEGAEPFPQFLKRILSPARGSASDPRQEVALMTAFGRLVGRMHAEGLFHRDLKLSNFAVSRADGLGPPQFWLLDLDSLNARRRLTWGRRVKNLAQVEDYAECKIPGVRWAHRGWFLRGYLAENPELRPRARELVALIRLAVARRSARRARKKGIMPNAQRTLTAIK